MVVPYSWVDRSGSGNRRVPACSRGDFCIQAGRGRILTAGRKSPGNATILIARVNLSNGIRHFLQIVLVVCSAAALGWQSSSTGAPQASSQAASRTSSASSENAKAKSIVDQGIQALGGQNYLNVRDREFQGRGYGFHHGRPTGAGGVFWSFWQFPDKERVELTKERDIAELYVGNKGWELTYKGARPIEQKDLDDYLRRRHYSLDNVLRTWINEPGVVLLFEGNAIAAQRPALKVTVVNTQNESVNLFFDIDTHLPVQKSFEWRDPVDRQKNLEEEVYDSYKPVSGIMAPFNITRFFNGDMASQRFLNSVTINQGLEQAMFDPNSGYNPNKPEKKKK